MDFIRNDNKQNFLLQTTDSYTKAYNSVVYQYKELSKEVFTQLFKSAKIDEKLLNIQTKSLEEQKQIKADLYTQTISKFDGLKNKKILDIIYILPDNSIYLDINPTSNLKLVSNKSEIVNYVQKNKTFFFGYEINDYISGYNFAYPLIKNNTFVGVISIIFSEEAICSTLMQQYEVLSNFILNEKAFKKDLMDKSSTYQKAHFEGFLHNKNILKNIKNSQDKTIIEIKPSKQISKKLYEQGKQETATSTFVGEKNSIVTLIPIFHKTTNIYEGFISIISKGAVINLLNTNYYTILFLFIFLNLAVILLVLQQQIKTIQEKEVTRKILIKDKQLLEQAKMAQMGEMIANIAHQWRQPLSAISTLASGVKLHYEFGLLKENEISKNMDLIVENTNYLSKTIDTFRDFIKEKREEKEVIVQTKIDESLKIIQASLENNYIKLIKDIDYKRLISIKMIPEELSQVIINIINNAKDAILQNKIKDGWIKISQKSFGNKLKITIEDNAKGIEKEVIDKIFDPYFTTKHQSQGTGLGLYMSKTIVEKHLKGKLKVQNGKNGAIFTIELDF